MHVNKVKFDRLLGELRERASYIVVDDCRILDDYLSVL